MEFLWPGDMTLFICFVQSSLFLPTTSPFWNQLCARVEAEEQNVSVAQSQRALGFSENNRLIEERTGALPALFQQVERL